MKKVLVDTSVWIDALSGKRNWQTKLFNRLIDDDRVVVCPVIIQEILQGIKSDSDFRRVKDNLGGFEVLNIDAVEAAYGAAALYRTTRKRGITIRKSNDCLIGFYAISSNVLLLHKDGDFDKMAQYSSLNILTELQK